MVQTRLSTGLPLLSKLRLNSSGLDILLAMLLGVIFGWIIYQCTHLINPVLFQDQASGVWFESDTSRVYANMTDPKTDHLRDKVHPLFSPVAYLIVSGLQALMGTDTISAVQNFSILSSSVWLICFYALLRLIGCRRFDAVLFSLLSVVSAAAVFWCPVPETYTLGSLTILILLCVVALSEHMNLSSGWYIIVNTITFSITITNWMAGILATAVTYSRKKAAMIILAGLVLAVGLWFLKKLFFTSATIPLPSKHELSYLLMPEAGGPWHILQSAVVHTLIMPTISIVDRYPAPSWSILVTQSSLAGSGTVFGAIAVFLWMSLLGLGVWGFVATQHQFKLRLVLGLTLLGQLALHLLYGAETFLYALHFVVLLIPLAAFSSFTKARTVSLVLVGLLILSAGINNFYQFNQANEKVQILVQKYKQVDPPKNSFSLE